MSYQEIADRVAREIRATIPTAKEPNTGAAPRRFHVVWSEAMMQVIKDRVAGAESFIELPIPASAPGAIGKCDGVVVRAMQDYDFRADKTVTRVDVAYI